ncbi:MAG: hypothetical protein JNK28_07570 [Burkholderiaceae bacterium]|nr:hypothetical protein [Burkholderiaceae bacterium]
MNSATIVQKFWNDCNVLRDDGMSYRNHVEPLPLKDAALADSDNLPPPEVIAQEIVDDLEAALEQFRLIAGDLAGAESA